MLRGTWATIDFQKAVELGYNLVKLHEVWHFREEDRRVGLFADYVNTWLKIKQESTGWPDDCNTPNQKVAYVQAYQEREGTALENVAKNPGRKTVAKLKLNRWETVYVQKTSTPKNVKLQKKSPIKTQTFNWNGMHPFQSK